MRVLVISAHPSRTSFVAALHARVRETLAAKGHEIDDLDLCAERFDPVMPRESLADYSDVGANTRGVEAHVARVRAADALALTYPIWCDGLPAILQGYFQRVFLPGVAFTIDAQHAFHRNLQNIRRLAAVCTYGAPESAIAASGDPPRRFICNHIGGLIAPDAAIEFLACYDMNHSTLPQRQAFLERVAAVFSAW